MAYHVSRIMKNHHLRLVADNSEDEAFKMRDHSELFRETLQ